jgi:dTDP-4-amino-4,6-dideoxygalactose transaminase
MRRTGPREMAAVARVMGRGQFSRYGGKSPSVTDRFETELAAAVGAWHALAVNSGTSALMCALVGAGIGPGDEVLVPAYTWVSSAAAALLVGAVPVLVDIDDSLTIDPAGIAEMCTEFTKAIIPVHMNNLVCDMDPIMQFARQHDLVVVEDACQAAGVMYRGRRVGAIGDVGAFSFNQHKNITSGEGGAIVTDDEAIAVRAGMYHDVGSYIRPRAVTTELAPFVGMNLRMPEQSSAMLRPQLRRVDQQMARRRRRRELMIEALESSTSFTGRVVRHHSPDDAVALAVQFDDEADAVQFSRNRGVTRLIESGRHVFVNWQPIQDRRTHDPRVDPWARHPREIDYSSERYATTLDILARSCSIGLPPSLPLTAFRILARTMFG